MSVDTKGPIQRKVKREGRGVAGVKRGVQYEKELGHVGRIGDSRPDRADGRLTLLSFILPLFIGWVTSSHSFRAYLRMYSVERFRVKGKGV